MKVSTDDLLAILGDIKRRVADGDSFEGSLAYTATRPDLDIGQWEVAGAYRIGDSLNRGEMTILEPTPSPPSYQIIADGKAIKCLYCCRVSWSAGDVEARFCGACGVFHE